MSSNINWNEVIKKEARGSNNEDFGEVQEVSDGYVFVQKGMINKEKFFIPQDKAEIFDGNVLRFNISEDEAYNSYQRDSFPTSSSSSSSSSPQTQQIQSSNNQESDEITIPVKEEKIRCN